MLIALVLAALAAPGDPDGVVTTAPVDAGAVMVGAVAPTTEAHPDAAQAGRVTPRDLTTQEQIDRWLSPRSAEVEPFADAASGDDRQMHGFVSGAIGTNDYSSVSVGVSLPIGESGRLDLAYSQTKNGYGFGYGYPGYGYGYDYPADHGYGWGAGYGVRPFGGLHSDSVRPGRSRRSISLGFSWDDDKDRDDRPGLPRGRTRAGD
jgi:hypothetical protein